MRERPLVAFTLLGQLAVGGFVTLGVLDVAAGGLGDAPVARLLTDRLLLAVGPVMGAALLASLLHLGSPANAWRALANLRTSWLSREILLALLFTGTGALFAILRLRGPDASAARAAVGVLAAGSGVALVYAMARVYRLRTVPGWDRPRTTLSFFLTAAILGSLGVGAGLALLLGPHALAAAPLRTLAVLGGAGCLLEAAAGAAGAWHAARRALLAVATVLSAAFLLTGGLVPALVAAAFGAALAAQVVGRYLFYVEGPRREL